MNDRTFQRTSFAARRYRPARWVETAVRVLVLLAVVAFPGAALGAAKEIKPNGRWKRFEVKAPGAQQVYLFRAKSGVSYRVTVEGTTLQRSVAQLLFGRMETATAETQGTADEPAVIEWTFDKDTTAEIRITGFSFHTGKGRVRLHALDWQGKPTKTESRWLSPAAAATFRVSDLLLGEVDEWALAVEPGLTYQVSASKGRVARVHMLVRRGKDDVLGDSNQFRIAGALLPSVRFRVPPLLPDEKPQPVTLVVSAVWPSAGDYGVRLTALGDVPVEPPGETPIPSVELGVVEGTPLTFTLDEGDMAVLWIPEEHPLP